MSTLCASPVTAAPRTALRTPHTLKYVIQSPVSRAHTRLTGSVGVAAHPHDISSTSPLEFGRILSLTTARSKGCALQLASAARGASKVQSMVPYRYTEPFSHHG